MKLISIEDAAAKTRTNVVFRRARIFRKELRFVKLGRRVLIPQETVDELIKRGVVEPKNKAQADSDSEVSCK